MKNHKTELPEMPVPIKNSEANMSYHSLITYTTPNIWLHFPTEMEYDLESIDLRRFTTIYFHMHRQNYNDSKNYEHL